MERARSRNRFLGMLLGLISAVLLACVSTLVSAGSVGIPELLILLLVGIAGWFTLSSFRSSSRGFRRLRSRLSEEAGVGRDTSRSLSPGDGSPVMKLTESTTKLLHSEKRGDSADL